MTFLVYTENAKDPGLLAQTTHDTLGKLFPDQPIQYSSDLDIEDQRSDERFTIVLPGNNLYTMHYALEDSGARQHLIAAVKDYGAHYIGFCAGAYYGATQMIAAKNAKNTFSRFDRDHAERANMFSEISLNMIENTTAIGPFLPYQNAVGEHYKTYSHTAQISDHKNNFSTLYIEGPLFLNHDLTGLYDNQHCIVANYHFNYEPEIEIAHKNNIKSFTIKKTAPAVLHDETKGSHRYLIGPHPELASTSKTFIPAFEKQFYPKYAAKMSEQDKNQLVTETAEAENLAFLKRTLTF